MTRHDEHNPDPGTIDEKQKKLYGEGQDAEAKQQSPAPTVEKMHPTSNDAGEQTHTKHGHPGEPEHLRSGEPLDTSDKPPAEAK
jgi:hypothetical protein